MINSEINQELETIVGERYISTDPEITYLYHYDFITTEPEGTCDIVIMPKTAEEVQDIIKIANKYEIPVVPWVSGINFGSIATPRKGGIVVDMRRMNKVLDVNEDDMYAVVEGGITWADLKGYLDKCHPDLKAGITWSPPGTGVVPSCLCYGMFDLGMLGGTGAEFVNGIEAVLGTGDLVRVGSSSLSNCWYGRQPLPDLAGLFIGWEGTTGIVTKMAIKLWPKLPFREDFLPIAQKMEDGVPLIRKLSKAGLGIFDLCVLNLGWSQSLMGFDSHEVAKDPIELNLPDFLGLVSTQAYTEKQHEAQCEAIKSICNEFNLDPLTVKEQIDTFPENMHGIMNHLTPSTGGQTPVQFWGCWNFARGGGGQWIGSYCSTRDIVKYYYLSRDICLKYDKVPQFYCRLMFGGHYCVSRTNINFNKNDPDDIQKARNLLKDIHDAVQSLDGVVMYKAPLWAVESYKDKTLPATTNLIGKLKKLLDPKGIMNPGQGIGDE
ncbi:MAG: FAD-binding protein [Candidatus Lokiarchaeota archaeon]|nr:FAD-binding protein [Candidatus Lokiarchaeota archaeon]MBD3341404.1 FAD-binding protein [Candidatus Lokiarchaeota archaeon]